MLRSQIRKVKKITRAKNMNLSAWVFPSDKTDFVLWSLRHGELVTATNISVCLSATFSTHRKAAFLV